MTPPTPDRFSPLSHTDLHPAHAAGAPDKRWLWHGYIAPGEVTLLTSQWKSGKSTLMSTILAKMKTGGQLGGRDVSPGRAVIISEESPTKWFERSQVTPFNDHICWFCRPFAGKPRQADWLDLLDQILHIHERTPIDLLVIDPLANLSPMRTENDAGQMLDSILPLQRLTQRGVAVLLAHHPRKGVVIPGQAARGSGALSGFVDIIIEMQRVSTRYPTDRRRRLNAWSRHNATPQSLVIQLTPDGSDYVSLGSKGELTYEFGWPLVKAILEREDKSLTRAEILEQWPDLGARPSANTLWKWLTRAGHEKQVIITNFGIPNIPHQFEAPIWQQVRARKREEESRKWREQQQAQLAAQAAQRAQDQAAQLARTQTAQRQAAIDISADKSPLPSSEKPQGDGTLASAQTGPGEKITTHHSPTNHLPAVSPTHHSPTHHSPDPKPAPNPSAVLENFDRRIQPTNLLEGYVKGARNFADDCARLGKEIERKNNPNNAAATPTPPPAAPPDRTPE